MEFGIDDIPHACGDFPQLVSMVYGQAVGDALGVPHEFQDRDSFTCTGMDSGGVHGQPAGTWSDDTSLMLASVDSLAANGWKLNAEDMRSGFRSWLRHGKYAVDGMVFDCGNTVRTALRQGRGCSDLCDNGNGSLMRILPFAFTSCTDDEIREASAMTHAHRISMGHCVELVHAARLELEGNPPAAGLERLASTPREDVDSGGYVSFTFHAALWCLANTGSYRDCVLTAVNLGADADTTAAVAGGLAGIRYGLDQIPDAWLTTLRGKDIIERVLDHAEARWATR